jgi:hypothetical protein
LISAPADAKADLLAEHKRDRTINTVLSDNLPGYPTRGPLVTETGECPEPVRYAFRSFDRQWIIPDKRVINQPNPGLWQVRSAPGQVFLTSLTRIDPFGGPSGTFTADIPDLDHYHGRGGRAWPMWLDAQGTVANVVPGLLSRLDADVGPVSIEDLFAYLAAVLGSPDYLERFRSSLSKSVLRIPVTTDRQLFGEAVALGRRLLWLHTFGRRAADPRESRPNEPPRLPAGRRPLVEVAIPHDAAGMPDAIEYDAATQTLLVGTGRISPVEPAAWAYEVSGMRVVKRWFDRRKKDPDGRRSSHLDDMMPSTWNPSWTTELLELLNVLTLVADMAPAQADLLDRITAGPLVTVSDLTAAGVLPIVERPVIEQPPKLDGRLPGF